MDCAKWTNRQRVWIYVGGGYRNVPNNTEYRPTHYYCVLGAKGINEFSASAPPGNQYPCCQSPTNVGGYATNGIFIRNQAIEPRRVSDGLSKTFLFGEMSWEMGEYDSWMGGISPGAYNAMSSKNIAHPLNSNRWDPDLGFLDLNYASFSSLHPSRGALFAMADGSGQFFSEDVELRTLKALASRDQAEVLSEDF